MTISFLVASKLIYTSRLSFVSKKSHVLLQLEMNVTHVTNQNGARKTVAPFVKANNGRIYLFSAIVAHIETDKAIYRNKTQTVTKESPTVIVTGWEHKIGSSQNFKCCFGLTNDKFYSVVSWNKTHWFRGVANLEAKQFKCPINFDVKEISFVTILSYTNASCPAETVFYIRPTFIERKRSHTFINRRKIGVCVKLTYGALDAHRLIEWFEAHKLFGVDRVIAYTYQLNSKATRVLKFYQKIGMAELHDFDLPEKDIIKREVGGNVQYWNDEQVVLFDCQERLRNYDYVAIIDTDEFLLPNTKQLKNAWKIYFEKRFRNESIGSLYFKVRIHAYNWGPSNENHPLHIGRYSNCTLPMYDRPKGVYKPSRIRQGSAWTHGVLPFKDLISNVAKVNEAVIHHYRYCRQEWMNSSSTKVPSSDMHLYHLTNTTKCSDFRRYHSEDMVKLADTVKDDVFQRIEEIEV